MGVPVAVQGLSITYPAPPAPPPGSVLAGIPTILVGGKPVAFQGSPLTPHGNPKVQPLCQTGPYIISTFVPTVTVSGIPIAHVGAICDCGHAIATGVPTVLVGGAVADAAASGTSAASAASLTPS
jgi:uncharacterized Zn-binding protein involved in type VI secretion